MLVKLRLRNLGGSLLYKWLCRDPDALVQRSCTSGPKGSCCRHPHREILHKRSADRDLAQMLLQDPGRCWHRHLTQKILIHQSSTGFCWGDLKVPCTRNPHTEILHKRSYRTLMQTSWHRDLAQEILIQRPCTRGPTGSWCKHPAHDREILHKRSTYRDLARVALQDPDADIMTERSCTKDPQTEILHKCSYRILGDLDTDILDKRSSYTDLV